MTGRRRKSYESGHRPKFLVIVDETDECDRALYFASRRAVRTNSSLLLLAVTDPAGFHEWLGVGDIIQQEAEEACQARLDEAADRSRNIAGIQPELIVRTCLLYTSDAADE